MGPTGSGREVHIAASRGLEGKSRDQDASATLPQHALTATVMPGNPFQTLSFPAFLDCQEGPRLQHRFPPGPHVRTQRWEGLARGLSSPPSQRITEIPPDHKTTTVPTT